MDATFFYIAGGALVALALIISFIGMKSESFPTDGQLRIGVILVAAVVAVTAAGAVSSSKKEAEHREAENAEAALAQNEDTQANEEAAAGGSASSEQSPAPEEDPPPQSGPADDTSSGADGEAIFVSNGCGGCHTLAAQADASGTIGPNLDEALVDKDTAFIKTSIVDPGAEVEDGYPDGVMPQDYGTSIAPADLDALVQYLSQATSGK